EMKKHPTSGAHTRARSLRQQMTEAEKSVWQMMRSRQIGGHRFRRPGPFGRYIADFACHEARLIIEIDGGQHDQASAEEAERTRFLESQGYRVLRFWSNEVLENLEGVWERIVAELGEHHPLPTLPHQGGGLTGRRPARPTLPEQGMRNEWR